MGLDQPADDLPRPDETLINTLERIAVALERIGEGVEGLSDIVANELSEISVVAIRAETGIELKGRSET